MGLVPRQGVHPATRALLGRHAAGQQDRHQGRPQQGSSQRAAGQRAEGRHSKGNAITAMILTQPPHPLCSKGGRSTVLTAISKLAPGTPLNSGSAFGLGRIRRLNVAAMQVPPFSLSEQLHQLGDALDHAVLEVLRSGQYIGGSTISGFETAFADACGVPHAIGCNSGTDALVLALRALGIGAGDEVITSSFSFFATAEAISAVGATPVFVDVDPDTYLIDLEAIGAAITPATRALMPVHLFGRPVDMERIMAIAAAHDLRVIEDCAQASGASWAGRPVGGWGDGEKKFRKQHESPEAWAKFSSMLAEGRRKLAEGVSIRVPRWDIVPIKPGMRNNLSAGSILEFPFEVVESMYTFRANEVVGQIAPRPLLLLHPAVDTVTPTEQSIDLFAHAGQPTDLHLVADDDHFMLAEGNVLSQAVLKHWLDKHFALAAAA
jgi:hypothetical protein